MERNWFDDNNINGGSDKNNTSYGNGFYGYNTYYTQPQNTVPPKKEKKNVTMGQLVVSLVAVALVFCIGGVVIGTLFSADKEKIHTTDKGGLVLVDPSANASMEPNATPTIPPSSGLAVSGNTSTATSATDMLQQCMSSIVGIYTESTVYDRTGQAYTQDLGSGSGVIVKADGYVVTNYHVIEGATGISVYLQDGTEYEAELIGSDSATDLAVLKIEGDSFTAATFGSSANSLVGEQVYAIGNPLGFLTTSVSDGIISGLDRTITVEDQSMTLMQTTAAVNPGNSGGGLFNAKGELIGVVNAKSTGSDVEGLGFAIPIDIARPIISDLMDYGFVTGRPFLGITMQNVTLWDSSFGSFYFPSYTTRVQIMGVAEGSCAEAAGLKSGDIILAFDGDEITGSSQLSAKIAEHDIGDVVTITVQRNNTTEDITVTLTGREQ